MKSRMLQVNRTTVFNILVYFILLVLALICLFPIIWMILTSFKPPGKAFSSEFALPVLTNYRQIFTRSPMFVYLRNSVFVALVSTALAMIIGVPTAYSLARFKIGGYHLPFWILSNRMLPPIAAIIPIFIIITRLKLLDTRIALVFPYLIFQIPFVVWMMRGFFMEIPMELEEAAMVGGCSRMGSFIRVVLPLSASGLSATAIFSIIFSWNEFMFALILTGTYAKTLPVAAASYITEMGIMWGELTATGTIIMAPILIFAILVQKYLVRGLTFGAIKG